MQVAAFTMVLISLHTIGKDRENGGGVGGRTNR
jgi:hypothetical protein